MDRVYASQPVVLPNVFCTISSRPKERPSPISFFFPVGRGAEEGYTVLIFKYVFHLFIISLDGELPTRQSGIVASYGELVGIHRTDVFGNGYPEVGRHRQRSRGQQMHILCHARIGCFGRISLSEVIAGGKAGLQRIVAFPLCVEQRCAYTCIQTEPGVYIEIVFGVKEISCPRMAWLLLVL